MSLFELDAEEVKRQNNSGCSCFMGNPVKLIFGEGVKSESNLPAFLFDANGFLLVES